MLRLLRALTAAVIVLGGCATYPDRDLQRLQSLPQHYVQFDAVVAWEITSMSPQTMIQGEFRNVRYMYMKGVEVWVAALDRTGKERARSVSYLLPLMLQRDETAPFSLKLPVSVVPGDRLRFTYKYTAVEGAGEEGGDVGNWFQSFDVEVPAQ